MSITPLSRTRSTGYGEPDAGVSHEILPYDDAEDSLLAGQISADSTTALEALISRYWSPLTSYASRIVGDMALAEDVVQKMFVKIWVERSDWSPRAVRAYLYRCTRNLALDEVRSLDARYRRERSAGRLNAQEPRQPDAILEGDSNLDAIDVAIQRLPDRRREAFVLAYIKQLTYREIASVMDISEKTVGHHISSALADLRNQLGGVERSIADSDPRVRPLHG